MSETSPYDEIPYLDLPVAPSQPENLAAIGKVRGMQPADIARARVLELGCANGLNLLTMAERLPDATFVGIDASERQIAAALETCQRVGLNNVSFRHQDLLDFDPDEGPFDFIIAQGVYSLVESVVRDKLLDICRRHLAPQGIAFVSYNTYPGWQIHDMLRHMMLYEARDATSTVERLEKGRGFADFLRHSLPAKEGAYQALVQSELERVLQPELSYVRHDHLGDVCNPSYFHQFIGHAHGHGLQLLGDCTLGIRYTDELNLETEQKLDELTPDAVLQEQFRDVLRNRPLRQTLLCHENIELRRSSSPEQLEGLYLESQLRPQNAEVPIQSTELQSFVAADGRQISAAVPLIKAALTHLGESWPQAILFEALVEAAHARLLAVDPGHAPKESAVRRLKENLVHSCYSGVIDVFSDPHPFVTRISERPTASPLARWQAQRGPVVTNRKHQSLRLDYLDQYVLGLLDGVRDLPQLFDELTKLAVEGKLAAMDNGQRIHERGKLQALLAATLPQCLSRLAQNAFLIA